MNSLSMSQREWIQVFGEARVCFYLESNQGGTAGCFRHFTEYADHPRDCSSCLPEKWPHVSTQPQQLLHLYKK